jgi:hypothetical protein
MTAPRATRHSELVEESLSDSVQSGSEKRTPPLRSGRFLDKLGMTTKWRRNDME